MSEDRETTQTTQQAEETSATATENNQTSTTEGQAQASQAETETETTATEVPVKQTDWRDREIARLRERTRSLREENEQLKTKPATTTETSTQPNLNSQEEFNRLVEVEANRRAQLIAQSNEFARRCAAVQEQGIKEFPDFNQRVNSLKGLVDWSDQNQVVAYNQFLSAIVETGDGAKVIYDLGGDPNKASAILNMTPVKMGIELAKMANLTQGEQPEVSRATRPITPVTRTNSNRSPIDPRDPDRADTLSTAEWMKRRNEQEAERFRTERRR